MLAPLSASPFSVFAFTPPFSRTSSQHIGNLWKRIYGSSTRHCRRRYSRQSAVANIAAASASYELPATRRRYEPSIHHSTAAAAAALYLSTDLQVASLAVTVFWAASSRAAWPLRCVRRCPPGAAFRPSMSPLPLHSHAHACACPSDSRLTRHCPWIRYRFFPFLTRLSYCNHLGLMPCYCLHDCHYFYRSALRLLNISVYISAIHA